MHLPGSIGATKVLTRFVLPPKHCRTKTPMVGAARLSITATPQDFDFRFGGSLKRNRRFDFATQKASIPELEEVSSEIVVSTSNPTGFDFCFGGSLKRNRRFDSEPETFDFRRNRFAEEVSSEIAVSTPATRLAFKILNSVTRKVESVVFA